MERPELSRGSRAERHTTRASQRRLASRRLASAARRSMDGWLAAPSTDSAHVASILTRVRRRLSSYTSLESYICRKLESAARCFTHLAKLTQHSRTIHSAPPIALRTRSRFPVLFQADRIARLCSSMSQNQEPMAISKLVSSLALSKTAAVSDKTAQLKREGRKIISLSVGEPDILPAPAVMAAAHAALDAGPRL